MGEVEGFTCEIAIESMEKWIKGEKEEDCRSCLLAPLSSWYVSLLEETGNNELANKMTSAFETGDALTIAQELDKIKLSVGIKLKPKLEEFDCLCQSHEQEDSA